MDRRFWLLLVGIVTVASCAPAPALVARAVDAEASPTAAAEPPVVTLTASGDESLLGGASVTPRQRACVEAPLVAEYGPERTVQVLLAGGDIDESAVLAQAMMSCLSVNEFVTGYSEALGNTIGRAPLPSEQECVNELIPSIEPIEPFIAYLVGADEVGPPHERSPEFLRCFGLGTVMALVFAEVDVRLAPGEATCLNANGAELVSAMADADGGGPAVSPETSQRLFDVLWACVAGDKVEQLS